MCEREFGQDPRDPIGNTIRLGVAMAKVVPDVVSKKEHGLKVCAPNWADDAAFLETSFALSVVALKEEDRMRIG